MTDTLKHILIAEDDELIIQMYQAALVNAPFQMHVVKDGGAAWDALQTFTPNVVILDIMMPRFNGIEVLTKIRADAKLSKIPVIKAWQLNERHYGALQGLNKPETVAKYGKEQVDIWRRSYDIPPPPLEKIDPRHPTNDPVYKNIAPTLLPSSECLKDTYNRSVPYFQKMVEPEIKAGKKIILSGHHNSLRAIIKYLDNISNEEIIGVNVPYCIPLVYELDENLKPIKHYYLASDEEVARVINSIKNQTKK